MLGELTMAVDQLCTMLAPLTEEGKRIALGNIIGPALHFGQRVKDVRAAIPRAERRLVGFNADKAAEAIEKGWSQRETPDEQLRRAHELSRKKRSGSYDDQLEADVRAAHEAHARGRDGRPKADKDKAPEDIETLVRRAAAEVAEKKRAPNMQNLRRMARE
ncbi:MAG: hypothetical protein J2P50_10560, partial [Hyphomicrobiaceae bacterium]|nr:hypothetical protein [Hyphomicrobiaceae bacterium]